MRSSLLVVAFLLMTAGALAQQHVVLQKAPDTRDCPVGLTAQQRGTPLTVWSVALEDKGRGGLNAHDGVGVHVDVDAKGERRIEQVDLAVRYLPQAVRALPADKVRKGWAQPRTKHFSVPAEGGAKLKLAADLLVGRASGVKTVELTRVMYADGSEWKQSAGRSCVVEPNGFLPVSK